MFFVQKEHYEYVLNSYEEGLGLSKRYWDNPEINYKLIDGDKEILPDIRVIRTDGHIIGIQSVVIGLKNTGNVLITSDAMRDSRMLNSINPAQYSMFDNNIELLNEGVIKLKKIIKELSIRLIIYNHDGDCMERI